MILAEDLALFRVTKQDEILFPVQPFRFPSPIQRLSTAIDTTEALYWLKSASNTAQSLLLKFSYLGATFPQAVHSDTTYR